MALFVSAGAVAERRQLAATSEVTQSARGNTAQRRGAIERDRYRPVPWCGFIGHGLRLALAGEEPFEFRVLYSQRARAEADGVQFVRLNPAADRIRRDSEQLGGLARCVATGRRVLSWVCLFHALHGRRGL